MQHTIQIDPKTHIAYTDIGDGPPILFIHGLGSSQKAFVLNTSTLSQHYRCISIDLPGYGNSSKSEVRVGISFFATRILQLLDLLQLPEVTLIGHSMGAQVALKMVHIEPAIATHLVLLAPAGFETFNGLERQWFESITQPNVLKNASRDQIRQSFLINFHAFPYEANFMLEDRLQMMQSDHAMDFYCELIYYATMSMLEEPVFQLLDSITQKALIIFGQEDQLVPNQVLHPGETTRSIAQRGASRLANSHLIMVPMAGHFVMFEKPKLVNQAIHEFLA